jgi:hypothetical protein
MNFLHTTENINFYNQTIIFNSREFVTNSIDNLNQGGTLECLWFELTRMSEVFLDKVPSVNRIVSFNFKFAILSLAYEKISEKIFF